MLQVLPALPVMVKPPLRVDMVLSMNAPAKVKLNAKVTYKLMLKNNSKLTATGVALTTQLPDNADFVSASNGCSRSGNQVSCVIGTIKGRASKTISIAIKPVATGVLSNSANVTINELESNSVNNSASATVIVK